MNVVLDVVTNVVMNVVTDSQWSFKVQNDIGDNQIYGAKINWGKN